MRAINEQTLLDQVRRVGPIARTDLARLTGISKPTVAMALGNLEQDGLIEVAGRRTGVRGPAAVLYRIRPEAGFVLALDVGREYLRGAIADLAGSVRSRESRRVRAASGASRISELVALTEGLAAETGITRRRVTQTVVGSPGVYDPRRGALSMARGLPGWERPEVLVELRSAFGSSTVIENDVNLAALAERDHGHGRGVGTFAFISVGTGIGLGLVIDGRLHRGAHGAAGEIAFMPLAEDRDVDRRDARRRGRLEAAASAAAVVRAARVTGLRGALTARRVFESAVAGEARAAAVVAAEAALVARAVASVTAVVDPDLVVLGGGIGQAPGFVDAVAAELRVLAPVVPEVRVSKLGDDAVVDGCLAAGLERAWLTVTSGAPRLAAGVGAGAGGR
jgi:predicted NBD/HSP70 family sugar kinase